MCGILALQEVEPPAFYREVLGDCVSFDPQITHLVTGMEESIHLVSLSRRLVVIKL
jgi:phosphotransferase system IIA component